MRKTHTLDVFILLHFIKYNLVSFCKFQICCSSMRTGLSTGRHGFNPDLGIYYLCGLDSLLHLLNLQFHRVDKRGDTDR